MLETEQNKAIKKLYAEIVSNEIMALLSSNQYTETFKSLGVSFEVKQTNSVNSNIEKEEDETDIFTGVFGEDD